MNSYQRFYRAIAWAGLRVEGRFCHVSETISDQPTRLGHAGTWIHFANLGEWMSQEKVTLIEKEGRA